MLNNEIFQFDEIDSIYEQTKLEKARKESEEPERKVKRIGKVLPESKRKYAGAVVVRTQEEYDEWVESTHYTTLYHEDGTPYEVMVTIFKPGINPLEDLKPAFAFATPF